MMGRCRVTHCELSRDNSESTLAKYSRHTSQVLVAAPASRQMLRNDSRVLENFAPKHVWSNFQAPLLAAVVVRDPRASALARSGERALSGARVTMVRAPRSA